MGWDRYQRAVEILEQKQGDLDVSDCFALLRETAQTLCPTVVSMVLETRNEQHVEEIISAIMNAGYTILH